MKTRNTEIIRGLSDGGYENKQTRRYVIIFVVIILLISGLYLRFAWKRYQKVTASEAVILAQSIESLLHAEHIEKLSATPEDLDKPEYIMLKGSLVRLAETSNLIDFIYLMGQRDGQIITMVDSTLRDSPNYFPSVQAYEKADDIYLEDFRSEKMVLSNPITDQWGTLTSMLIPVRDSSDGKIIAVLGIDYDAWEQYLGLWKRMIPDMIITFTVLLLFFALLYSRKLREKLLIDEVLYYSVFDQAPIGIAIVKDKSFITHTKFKSKNINRMFQQILGRTSTDLAKRKWTDITHPEDLQADLEKFEQFTNGEINGYCIEKRFIRPDGSSVWTNMKIAPLLGGAGKHSTHLCLLEDISIRKEAKNALRESEREKSVLLSNLPGMAYRCNYDREWTMQFVSAGCFDLTGYTPKNLILNKDLSFNDLIAAEYRETLWKEWKKILAKSLPFNYEYEIITAKGERKWVIEIGEGIYNEKGEIESLEGIILDISDRKEMEKGLRYNTEHDMWTGLYNRRYLENLLNKDAIIPITGKRALVGINLGTFNSLSMIYGFQYSQGLIRKIAKVLKRLSTERHQLFNTYANRFVFYIKDYSDKNELLTFSKFVANKLDALLSVERIRIGIGIVEIKESNKKDISHLLKNLLIASEKAINATEAEGGICFFNKDMEASINRKETIKRELSEIAMEENSDRLFLKFQPVLDLTSNCIYEFEALARLNTHHLGLVSPLEFIPLAEETKLIIPLGEKIIQQAFEFLNDLHKKGLDDIGIYINISAIQLLGKNFVKRLFKIIHEMQVNPVNITLEITESVFTSSYKEIGSIIAELRDIGLKIAIDDFGTEYSSLARVRELNVNCLKIDKYFIDKLLELKPEEAITGDIISMAHKLGHYVIAEGIEQEEQVEYLKENDCDKIQGYLIGKPLDKEAAMQLIKDQTSISGKCY